MNDFKYSVSFTTAAGVTAPEPTLPAVHKRWPGCTMVIFGGGPSLTESDVRYVGERSHLARTIAIKEAYLLAPWADVLYACDVSWWRYYQGAPTYTGLKYTLEAPYPGVVQLENTGESGLELEPTGLRTGFNSGAQAINLAVHLGAVRILLLGFDCWRAPDGRSNWFTTKRVHMESPYPVFLQAFAAMVEPLKAAGVEVINCSRTTILRAFPRAELQDVL